MNKNFVSFVPFLFLTKLFHLYIKKVYVKEKECVVVTIVTVTMIAWLFTVVVT